MTTKNKEEQQQFATAASSPDEDVAMIDAAPQSTDEPAPIKEEEPKSVKVEDLFLDMDDGDLDDLVKGEDTPPSSGEGSPMAVPISAL
jgi:hypothetical protein